MWHELLVYCVVAMCLWAIVAPAIPTCVLGTAGLCCVGIGALLTLDYVTQPAIDVVLIGVLLGGGQVMWRSLKTMRNKHARRMSDWAPRWEDTRPDLEAADTGRRA